MPQPSGAALGHALTRLRALEAKLMCPICHELPTAPVALTACGHVFCSLCIRRYLRERASRSRCPYPVCRQPATATALLPLRVLDCEDIRAPASRPPPDPDSAAEAQTEVPTPADPLQYRAQIIDAKAPVLRASLVRAGLPDTGTLDELSARHHEFVLVHNAAMDGARTRSRHEIVDAVLAWEKGFVAERNRANNAAKRKAAGSAFCFSSGPAPKRLLPFTAEENKQSSAGRAMTSTFDHAAGDANLVPAVGDSFADLIRKASMRKEAYAATASDVGCPAPVVNLDDGDDDDVPSPPTSPVGIRSHCADPTSLGIDPCSNLHDEPLHEPGCVLVIPRLTESHNIVDSTPSSPTTGRLFLDCKEGVSPSKESIPDTCYRTVLRGCNSKRVDAIDDVNNFDHVDDPDSKIGVPSVDDIASVILPPPMSPPVPPPHRAQPHCSPSSRSPKFSARMVAHNVDLPLPPIGSAIPHQSLSPLCRASSNHASARNTVPTGVVRAVSAARGGPSVVLEEQSLAPQQARRSQGFAQRAATPCQISKEQHKRIERNRAIAIDKAKARIQRQNRQQLQAGDGPPLSIQKQPQQQ
jgi:Zinc finger, C3HC4 type (RING finger)